MVGVSRRERAFPGRGMEGKVSVNPRKSPEVLIVEDSPVKFKDRKYYVIRADGIG